MNLDRWIDPACAERSRIAVRFARSIAGREYRPSETVSQSDWMDQSPEDARSTQVREAHGVYVPVRVPERDGEFHLSVDARLLGPGWLGPHPPSPGRNPACDTLRSCPTGAPFGRCTQLVVVTLRTPTSKGPRACCLQRGFDAPLSRKDLSQRPGPATGRSGAYPGGTHTRQPDPASRRNINRSYGGRRRPHERGRGPGCGPVCRPGNTCKTNSFAEPPRSGLDVARFSPERRCGPVSQRARQLLSAGTRMATGLALSASPAGPPELLGCGSPNLRAG